MSDTSKYPSESGTTSSRYTEPEPSLIQRVAKAIYDKLYNPWPPGDEHKRHGSRFKLPLDYLFYATMRWGLAEGITRYWEFHLHPRNLVQWAQDRYRRYKLVDRRPKSYSRIVYAINRDGDFYLVECPRCHKTQGLGFNWSYEGKKPYSDISPPKTFQCHECDIGFWVHLEDGLRDILDHRMGTPSLPSVIVFDGKIIRLGLAKDAPWWWTRREIYRDLQPNGKDGHNHHPYEIFPLKQDFTCCGGQAEAEQPK